MTRPSTASAPLLAAAIAAVLGAATAFGTPQEDEVPPPRPTVPVELQSKINTAIDLGVESLLARQSLDGSWTQQVEGYGPGMTGLALYALMKSGLSTEHPAIERGFTFLRRHTPTKTYSRSTVMLAVATRADRGDSEWLDELVESLAKSQVRQGWGYPGSPDLSNTQFAAMALRAADAAGASVPAKVWTRLAEAALLYVEEAEGDTRSGYEPRGFRYRTSNGEATGSMTGAGVAVLSICLDHMRGKKAPYVRAFEKGKAWIDEHFTVKHNPVPATGRNHGHYHYYLYGMERVGSLLNVETFGAHPWYLLGAEKLVDSQLADGSWGGQADTAFGLLFLSRATGSLGPASTGGKAIVASRWTFGADDPKQSVSLRASGRKLTTLWISSFGDDARFKHATDEEGNGPLPVERVEYWRAAIAPETEPSLLQAIDVRDAKEGARKRYAVQQDLGGPRLCTVFARVYLEGQDKPLESKPLQIRVGMTERDTWTEYATDHERNLLNETRVEVSFSSEMENPRGRAANAIDGMVGLGWKPLPEDTDPWIRIELQKQVRANTLLLSHGELNGALLGRYEIIVNGRPKDRITGTMVPDAREKTVITFPKAVKIGELRIRFLDVPKAGLAGLGEIELQRRR